MLKKIKCKKNKIISKIRKKVFYIKSRKGNFKRNRYIILRMNIGLENLIYIFISKDLNTFTANLIGQLGFITYLIKFVN